MEFGASIRLVDHHKKNIGTCSYYSYSVQHTTQIESTCAMCQNEFQMMNHFLIRLRSFCFNLSIELVSDGNVKVFEVFIMVRLC